MTLPLKTARKAVATAHRKLIEARLELAAALNQMEKATAQEHKAALVDALRRKRKGGRPIAYPPPDKAALRDYMDTGRWPRHVRDSYDRWRGVRRDVAVTRIEFLLTIAGRDSSKAQDWQRAMRRLP